MSPVRVAMLSMAHVHADSYSRVLAGLPGAALAGIWDDDRRRGQRAARMYGVPFYGALQDALEASDAVCICAENSKHAALAVAAARVGRHVLTEKPIATTMADAQSMIDACSESGVQLMVAFPCRYIPAVVRARQVVRSRQIGRVLAVRGTNRGTMPGGWFTDPALAGGGAVMDHTVHVADLLRWLLGQEVTEVYAEVDRLFHDIPCDDCGVLTMELNGGTFATLDPSWSRNSEAFPTWGDVTLKIVGTEGSVAVDAFGSNLTLYNSDARKAKYISFGEDVDQLMLADFVRCVGTGAPVPITGEDGLRAMEVALCAYRSAERRAPVRTTAGDTA